MASLRGCEGSGVLEGMLVVARCHGVFFFTRRFV